MANIKYKKAVRKIETCFLWQEFAEFHNFFSKELVHAGFSKTEVFQVPRQKSSKLSLVWSVCKDNSYFDPQRLVKWNSFFVLLMFYFAVFLLSVKQVINNWMKSAQLISKAAWQSWVRIVKVELYIFDWKYLRCFNPFEWSKRLDHFSKTNFKGEYFLSERAFVQQFVNKINTWHIPIRLFNH